MADHNHSDIALRIGLVMNVLSEEVDGVRVIERNGNLSARLMRMATHPKNDSKQKISIVYDLYTARRILPGPPDVYVEALRAICESDDEGGQENEQQEENLEVDAQQDEEDLGVEAQVQGEEELDDAEAGQQEEDLGVGAQKHVEEARQQEEDLDDAEAGQQEEDLGVGEQEHGEEAGQQEEDLSVGAQQHVEEEDPDDAEIGRQEEDLGVGVQKHGDEDLGVGAQQHVEEEYPDDAEVGRQEGDLGVEAQKHVEEAGQQEEYLGNAGQEHVEEEDPHDAEAGQQEEDVEIQVEEARARDLGVEAKAGAAFKETWKSLSLNAAPLAQNHMPRVGVSVKSSKSVVQRISPWTKDVWESDELVNFSITNAMLHGIPKRRRNCVLSNYNAGKMFVVLRNGQMAMAPCHEIQRYVDEFTRARGSRITLEKYMVFLKRAIIIKDERTKKNAPKKRKPYGTGKYAKAQGRGVKEELTRKRKCGSVFDFDDASDTDTALDSV